MKLKVIESSLSKIFLTILRDVKTNYPKFREYLERISEILISEALVNVNLKESEIKTPLSETIGFEPEEEVVFIPILRAGLSMVPPALKVYPYGRLGFIGTYRNEETLEPVNYYVKFPLIKNARYLILDPMLATGGTASQSVKTLIEAGIKEENITFVSVVSAPEGVEKLKEFEGLTVVTAAVDEKLNQDGYIVPGLGDAGDRFCGTENVEVVESHGI
ncbi:uracil phosphoribosyltransferase [Desulfurobacterium crinifex]